MKINNSIFVLAVITFLFIINTAVFAQQNYQQRSDTKISLEVDPITFGFNGYGLHLRMKPANIENLLFGIGAYAMDVPKALVDFNKNNKDKGWDVRLNQGYGLFFEYHFSKVNDKWFAGGQLGWQQYKIENSFAEGTEKYSNILLMTYGGYTWQPFKLNFYIKPWAGIGYTTKISGTNSIGNLEYDISPVIIFATLHVGYTF